MALPYQMYNGFNQYGMATPMMSPVQNPMQNQGQYQIQNGGFISVSSEEEARKYLVAPGNSVTFKNENAPYVYTKTMGFSQLDRPLFEKFRLVKEEDSETSDEDKNLTSSSDSKESQIYLVQEDLDPLVKDIKNIQTKIKEIDSVLEGFKSSCDSQEKQAVKGTNKSSNSKGEK